MKIEQLTFTRFIAAILVVIFHYGKDVSLFTNQYVAFLFSNGNLAVSYFFILSGFVMIVAYGNKGKVDFFAYMKNRMARIYPVYFLATLLWLSVNQFKNISTLDLGLNVLMIQSWIPQKALTINFPSWSLSVELLFYITFSFLINKIYNNLKLKSNAFWIISFWLVSQIVFHLILNNYIKIPYYKITDIFYHPLLHLNEFLIGNLMGLVFIKTPRYKQKNYAIFIVFLILCTIFFIRFTMGLNLHNGLLAIIFAPLILLISMSNDKISKLFARSTFVFLGEISFGMYLLQVPVWAMFPDSIMYKYFPAQPGTSFAIRLLILIFLSSLSYLYFEKPLQHKIKTGFRKRC